MCFKMIHILTLQVLLDDCTFGGAGGFDYIVEGFDQLPRSFLDQLSHDIRFRSKVCVSDGTSKL